MIGAQAAQQAAAGMGLVPTIIAAVGSTAFLTEALRMIIQRRKNRGDAIKIEVDAASVISKELREWTTEANTRAKVAEERANAIEARLQKRIDELVDKCDRAEEAVERAEASMARTERALTRLQARIMSCQAGPVCPVRTADTNPGLPVINPGP